MKTTTTNLKRIAIAITLAVVLTFIPQFGTLVKADSTTTDTQAKEITTETDKASTEMETPPAETDIIEEEVEEKSTVVDVINHESPEEEVDKEKEEKKVDKKTDKKITKKVEPKKKTAPKKKYTAAEIEMIQYVVQNEAGYMNKQHKQIITEVILNRVASKRFPNTIKGVLSQSGQFTSWRNYLNRTKPPIKSTKDAVMSVLNGDASGVSKGALFFYAPKLTSSSSTRNWFERQTFVMQLSETIWGVTYTHRFFK